MRNIGFALALAGTGALVAACATSSTQTADALALSEDPRIGAKTDRICFQRTIDSWSTTDDYRDAVILTRGVSEDYLAFYTGACSAIDFRAALTIGVESAPGGGCLRQGDALLVEGPGDFVNRCFITDVYEWNEVASDEELTQ